MTRRIFALRMWILPDVSVRNLDYTTKGGYYVSLISGDTDENAQTATFTVSLSSAPSSGNVTVTMATSDTDEGVISTIGNSQSSDNASQLVFTNSNWNSVQDGDGDRCGGQLIRRRPELRDCADRRQ